MYKKTQSINNQFLLKRRELLTRLGLLPLLPFLPACQLTSQNLQPAESDDFAVISPINRLLSDRAGQKFTGDDDFILPHRILWNKVSYINSIGGLPNPKRKEALVIIGGGMSGLMSAFLLSDKKPVILEQAARFGGNAKGEAWNGLHYAIGAAYFVKPEPGSDFYNILANLGVVNDWTIKNDSKGDVVLNGKRFENFWSGKSEPEFKAVYKKVYDYFMSFINDGGNVFPDYPTDDAKLRQYINQLDQENFKDHLERIIGNALPPHLATLLEHYCFSSFGGSSTEISAAAGINFFAAEFSDIAVFPGGNAYVAEALLKRLFRELPAKHLLSGCLVFDVKACSDGVLVSYLDANLEAQSILAEKIIFSCPKFIAAKLIDSLPANKSAAISELEYRAYLVANLLINRPIAETDYDLYWLAGGNADVNHIVDYAKSCGLTDVINANYSSPDPKKTTLSFYQAFPYHGGRAELYRQASYTELKTKISAQLKHEIYPFYQLNDRDIVDLRLTRWGHPLPLAYPGLLHRQVVDHLRAPIDDRIYFIEQDNWALPAIETIVAEAVYWSSKIR